MTSIIYNTIGSLGVFLILSTYFLLQSERLQSHSISYSVLNGLGSLLILISLIYDFNFPSFIVELVWVIISLMGIVRWFGHSRRVVVHE